MRKQVLSFAVAAMALLFTTGLRAQISTPAASPMAKIETVVGLTDVHVEYSRPGVKGRKIFAADGLVPFGKVWRTGANQATKVTFGGDVMLGDAKLAGGSYAILTKPMMDMWEVMLFTYEGGNWGMYPDKTPVATLTVKSMEVPGKVENFTIMFDEYTMNSVNMYMMWDQTMVAVPIKTAVKEQVMANIDRVMAGPSMNDYYNAASFMADNGGNMKQAMEYINKAVEMSGDNPRYWMVRRQGLIMAEMGMKKEAMAAFNRSMALAKEAGNMDYVRLNQKSLKSMK